MAIDRELVALGMAAEVIMIVEHENARLRIGAPIEERRRKAADAAAHHDQIVALLGLQSAGRIMRRREHERMRGFECADVLPAQPGQRRGVAGGLRGNLHRGREPGRDRERGAVEEIAAGNLAHSQTSKSSASWHRFEFRYSRGRSREEPCHKNMLARPEWPAPPKSRCRP